MDYQIGDWLYYSSPYHKPSVVEVIGYCIDDKQLRVSPRITKNGKPVDKGTSVYNVQKDRLHRDLPKAPMVWRIEPAWKL